MAAAGSPPLTGKVCIVTGGSKGMGRIFVDALTAQGAHVAILARPSTALNEADADTPDTVLAVPCDVGDPAQVDAAIAAVVARFGRIDVLVNNAAIMALSRIEQMANADVDRLLAINIAGPLYCSRAVIPHLRAAGGGDIVFVTSEGAITPFPFIALYGATKAALEALAGGLRAELRAQGTRVVVLRSGRVEGSTLRDGVPADVQADFFKAMQEGGFLAATGEAVSRETMAATLVSVLTLPRDVNVDLIVPRGR